MGELILAGVIGVGGLFFLITSTRRQALHRESKRALDADGEIVDEEFDGPIKSAVISPKMALVAGAIGGAVTFGITWLLLSAPTIIAAAVSVIFAVLSFVITEMLIDKRNFKLEQQLVDSIDLMVASLRAGSGLFDAMEQAVAEVDAPLKPVLEETLARIRYGEQPQKVLRSLGERVPIESFWLFSLSQSVQWEVGGAIAQTLASIGNFIRDRVDIARNIRSQTAQARASMVAVAGIAYFIGFMVWRSNPHRMQLFIDTEVGKMLLAITVVMQAVGLIWITRLSRIRF